MPSHCESCGAAFPWSDQPSHATCATRSSGSVEIWNLLHSRIATVARARIGAGHYADAVEVALKEVNARVKQAYISAGQVEKDGADLMFAAFGGKQPTIRLSQLTSESGRNIQEGYTKIFAGAMQGIRNPKAHENINIDLERAWHLLTVASLLMCKLDEAGTA